MVIHLNYHQAQAVAERAARIRRLARQSRGYGLNGTERVIVTLGNPYYTEPRPENHGYYLTVGGAGGAPVPLFAKDLGYDRNFEATRLPARDEDGHVQHPDMDGIGWDEFDMGPQLRALGWQSTTVSFESDATSEMQDRYSDSNSPDCSYWTPTTPQGGGWLLAAIYDTEDGPVALFVRPAPEEDPGELKTRSAEIERLHRGMKALSEAVHNMTVANQAAWIEWRHGRGADAAMTWVHNGLAGPGFIPDETAPYGKEAQAWYDANNANPMPKCHCGRPSNIAWAGGGACSQAHYLEAKAAHEAQAGETTGG